ncbi:MAG: tRNA lysidine(34) synthetase TilS [Lentisphaeria bacterium]|nr:tRNA lysidine(34) synthetase TilS [Lentisphaeria bacterium]
MPSTTPYNLPIDLPPEIKPLMAGKTVYCSFSGGADSLALLLFLKEWSRRISFSLEAVHFEHGFRGSDSLEDADFCRTVCRREQIPFQLFRINVPAHRLKGEGDEEAARRMRLDYWRKIVRNPGNSLIALGHHADDRIENVLLRLFRGSNSSGLSSMRSIQKMGHLTLIRPFIELTRAEIEAWLAARQEKFWRYDSTNDSMRYRRNYLRLKLLPEIIRIFPFARGGIRQSIRTLESDAACLEQLAQQEFKRLGARLPLEDLAGIPSALRVRLLRIFLQHELQQPSFVPDSRLLERFEKLIVSPRPSAKIPIRGLPEWLLTLRHGVFQLQPSSQSAVPEKSWNPFEQPYCEWSNDLVFRAELLKSEQILFSRDKSSAFFDANRIRDLIPLRISCWKPGDKMIPFGKKTPLRLKKIFADAKIGTSERSDYPVIRGADDSILWVARLRNSNFAPVAKSSGEVLRLSVIQKHLQHQC